MRGMDSSEPHEPRPRHPVTLKRVLYDLPDVSHVTVLKRHRHYRAEASTQHTLDVYGPPGWRDTDARPAVVLVSGFSDAGAQQALGCRISEMESFVSWGRLVAASGLVGITYTMGPAPAEDLAHLLEFVRAEGHAFGVDGARVGLWACSGHVPTALSALMQPRHELRCAALCYGYMLDLDGATPVADAQKTWRFANPNSGRTVADLSPETPLCIVRAGRDTTVGVNASIDAFVNAAVAANLPLTFVNHHDAPHAFDVEDDSAATRHVVAEVLSFLRTCLSD